jgi:Dolichyl-phosphate-mannose-protein mannosyltransferase
MQKTALMIPVTLAALIAATTLAAAIVLVPWLRAAPVPVQLHFAAPANTRIRISWDSNSQATLPLVPAQIDTDGAAKLWLAELPPLPSYQVSFVFDPPPIVSTPCIVDLIDVRNLAAPIFHQAFSLSTPTVTRLNIPNVIIPHGTPTFFTILILWICLLTATIGLVAILIPLFARPADLLPPANIPAHWRAPLIAFAIATAIRLLILPGSQVILRADSTLYLAKANALAQHNTTDLGGNEFELDRLPGYPFILATIFRTLGNHLTTVALIQTILFSLAVLAFAYSLRNWIHPALAAIAIFVAILSPPQIWAARAILTESTFATFSLLALAAFFCHISATPARSKLWLAIYGLLVTIAIFIRPNGIALFASSLPACLMLLRRGTFRTLAPYAVSLAIAVVCLFAWSYRNLIRYGYFTPSDMTGVTLICGQIAAGSFDVDSLAGSPLYEPYLQNKFSDHYLYPGFNLRHEQFIQHIGNSSKVDRSIFPALDRSLLKLAARSKRLSPWQLNCVALLRSAWWAVAWPDVPTYSGGHVRVDYFSPQETIAALFSQFYFDVWYELLSALAFLSAVFILWRGHAILAAPIFIFLANILLNVFLLNVVSRYIQIMDGLLYFQVALGITLFLNRNAAPKKSANIAVHQSVC